MSTETPCSTCSAVLPEEDTFACDACNALSCPECHVTVRGEGVPEGDLCAKCAGRLP